MNNFALHVAFFAFCVMGGYGLHDMAIAIGKLIH